MALENPDLVMPMIPIPTLVPPTTVRQVPVRVRRAVLLLKKAKETLRAPLFPVQQLLPFTPQLLVLRAPPVPLMPHPVLVGRPPLQFPRNGSSSLEFGRLVP